MKTVNDNQLVPVKDKNTLSNVVGFTAKHADKAVIIGVCALATVPAFAAIDVSGVVDEIKELKNPINLIGAAILGIAVVIFGWRLVRSVLR